MKREKSNVSETRPAPVVPFVKRDGVRVQSCVRDLATVYRRTDSDGRRFVEAEVIFRIATEVEVGRHADVMQQIKALNIGEDHAVAAVKKLVDALDKVLTEVKKID